MISAVSALPEMTVSGPWTRSRFSGRSGPVRRSWRPLRRPWGPSWRPPWRPWTTLLRRWWGLGEFLHNSFRWKSFVCPLIHSFKKVYTKNKLTRDTLGFIMGHVKKCHLWLDESFHTSLPPKEMKQKKSKSKWPTKKTWDFQNRQFSKNVSENFRS